MKTLTVMGGLLVALGFFAGAVQGCGSSAADNKALCKKGCDKTLMCHPELAAFLMNCEATCSMKMGTTAQPCKNESAIIAKYNECLGKACGDAFDSCLMTIPACEGGGTTGTGGSTTGTGGKGGSGGSTGTGGSSTGTGGSGSDASASAGCEACTKADACCNAFGAAFDGGGGQCMLVDDCNAATGNDRASIVSGCQMFVMNFSTVPSAPAACK
ncbi:MAG TPA: hypothetical protein VFH73_20820 [Polyangia bacterium]|nr:hypothetical protein [Polyangia bacterium]